MADQRFFCPLCPVTVALVVFLTASCSPDEPFIDSFNDSWRIVGATGRTAEAFVIPGGGPSAPTLWNGDDDSSVVRVVQFRDNLYVVSQNPAAIVVLQASTQIAVDTIDVSQTGSPWDIAFPNATSAYVSFPDSDSVGVLDLTTSQLVRSIYVGGAPRGIRALGNQIVTACASSDDIAVLDSRTLAVEARFPTAPCPWFVDVDPRNVQFLVLCRGAGRIDTRERTVPALQFFDPATRTMTATLDATARAAEGLQQEPTSLAVTDADFVYVTVQNGLLRASTRTRQRLAGVNFDGYTFVAFNAARSELVALQQDGRTIDVYDGFFESRRSSTTLSSALRFFTTTGPRQ